MMLDAWGYDEVSRLFQSPQSAPSLPGEADEPRRSPSSAHKVSIFEAVSKFVVDEHKGNVVMETSGMFNIDTIKVYRT